MIHNILLLAFLYIIEYTHSTPTYSVTVPTYPTITEAPLNQAVLNTLAKKYYESGFISDVDFVFDYLPVQAFKALNDPVFLLTLACTKDDLFGILYFAGYWGGVWLRPRLTFAPPAQPAANLGPLASASINNAVTAATGSSPLEYVKAEVNGSCDSFGYNCGYITAIRSAKPSGVVEDSTGFSYDTALALQATFTDPQLGLDFGDKFWFNHLNYDSNFLSLKLQCRNVQYAATERGQATWTSPGLTVKSTISSSDWNLLKKSSFAFLEIARVVAFQLTKAVGYNSEILARYAAFLNGAFKDFSTAYTVGLLDGTASTSFPTIIVS